MKKTLRTKSALAAQNILDECGLDNPSDMDIEDIIQSQGVAAIQSVKMNGSQARIMINGSNSIISINQNIKYEPKRRFILAHELGHHTLHKNLKYFNDDAKSLSEWLAKGKHEKEANEFASELLMPSQLFMEEVGGKKFNFDIIKTMSSFFCTSLTATLLKYKTLGDYPIAVVYSENKRVKWSSFSHDFVLPFIPNDMFISDNCVAIDHFNNIPFPKEPEEVDVYTWFDENRNVEKYSDIVFYEQCISIDATGGVLSCIWND
jgi:Zn-dependent peptidase ImmA (M78 family)